MIFTDFEGPGSFFVRYRERLEPRKKEKKRWRREENLKKMKIEIKIKQYIWNNFKNSFEKEN